MQRDEIKQTVWSALKEVTGCAWERLHDLAYLRDDLGLTRESLAFVRLLLCDETGADIPLPNVLGCLSVNDLVFLTEAVTAQDLRDLRDATEHMRRLIAADAACR